MDSVWNMERNILQALLYFAFLFLFHSDCVNDSRITLLHYCNSSWRYLSKHQKCLYKLQRIMYILYCCPLMLCNNTYLQVL